jgi:hypothetical protein
LVRSMQTKCITKQHTVWWSKNKSISRRDRMKDGELVEDIPESWHVTVSAASAWRQRAGGSVMEHFGVQRHCAHIPSHSFFLSTSLYLRYKHLEGKPSDECAHEDRFFLSLTPPDTTVCTQ